jgi:rubrerythrin
MTLRGLFAGIVSLLQRLTGRAPPVMLAWYEIGLDPAVARCRACGWIDSLSFAGQAGRCPVCGFPGDRFVAERE